MNQAVGRLYKTGLKRGLRVPGGGRTCCTRSHRRNTRWSLAALAAANRNGLECPDRRTGATNLSAWCAYYFAREQARELGKSPVAGKAQRFDCSAKGQLLDRMTANEAAESFTNLTKRIDFIDEGDGSQPILT